MLFAVQFILVLIGLGVCVALLVHWVVPSYFVGCCVSVGLCLILLAATEPLARLPHGNSLTWMSDPFLTGAFASVFCLGMVSAAVGLPFRYMRARTSRRG